MNDPFRPMTYPARPIYDAIVVEAEYRSLRSEAEWIVAERDAAWRAARNYAQQHGLRIPSAADVEQAEKQAVGHCDYAARYARGVARCMSNK